jgi:CRISPR-associated protein Cas2
MQERWSEYRIMWILIFFDLPTETSRNRKNYTKFREYLLEDGFTMFQFSIYTRHCPSRENADVHVKRVRKHLPPLGKVGILTVTDKQFGMMELFVAGREDTLPPMAQQLEMF